MEILKAMGKGLLATALIVFILLVVFIVYAIILDKEIPQKEEPKQETTISGPNWSLISSGRKVLNDMIDNPDVYIAGKDNDQVKAFNEILNIYNEKTFMDNSKREELLYHSLSASTYDGDTNYIMALKAFRDHEEAVINGNN